MSARPITADCTLRPGRAADLDRVMAIMASAFEPGFGEGWSKSQCEGILPLDGVELTLAEDAEHGVAGFALQRWVADESELLLLAVTKAAQGRGLGAMLLGDFVDSARRRGLRRVHLEVRDGNPAIAMYRGTGFAVVGRRRDYYHGHDGSQHDALTMALEL